MTHLSILYFGMLGELSRRPLEALLEAGINIKAVVIPGTDDQEGPVFLDPPDLNAPELGLDDLDFVPMVSQYMQPSVITLAWENKIRLAAIYDLHQPAAYDLLAEFAPDLVCVSCFSKIIPPRLLQLPKLGVLNLHPALLPKYRGPSPVFWQLHNGEPTLGVTVHYMNEHLDSGDIVLQAKVPFPDGATGSELETLCAEAGAGLMVEAVRKVSDGTAARTPQVASDSSYYPLPSRADLILTPQQSAQSAYNFVCGIESPGGPLPFEVHIGEEIFAIDSVVGYNPNETLGVPYRREDDVVVIQFTPGVLRIREPHQTTD
jgi:methionyl-tRNA formyltransferase